MAPDPSLLTKTNEITASNSRFHNSKNSIKIDDIVWAIADHANSSWWPAKVIWTDEDLFRVEYYNLETDMGTPQQMVTPNVANLIKPFTEFVSN